MAESGAAGKHSLRNKMKKRKKKFLANVKGFGKQGNFGRGTHLESDEWNYYINILDSIKSGFDSLEDKSETNFRFFILFIQSKITNSIVYFVFSLS